MSIYINNNIPALAAQRRLADHTSQLRRTSERLSSGMRINRASDDPATVNLSSLLSTDARVYNQGIRNANDGLSVLNIAEGAAQELSSVLIRIAELSEAAANGTLTSVQRSSLHAEASALRNEYNRIIDSVKFNDRALLNGTFDSTHVQIGYGENGRIALGIELGLTEARGTGAYTQLANSGSVLGFYSVVRTADFNNDGISDVFYGSSGTSDDFVMIGNGDGTFKAPSTSNLLINTNSDIELVDFNQDGYVDVAGTDNLTGQLYIQLGSSSGTFSALVSYLGAGDGDQLVSADFNGDTLMDIASVGSTLDIISVFLGNGNGTFKGVTSIATGDQWNAIPGDIATGDFNNDGISDLVTYAHNDNKYDVFFGVGNGTFAPRISITRGVGGYVGLSAADLNRDGYDDIVSGLEVLLSNGDGTFSIPVLGSLIFTGNTGAPVIADFNGDGIDDFIKSGSATSWVFLGNGNGTFSLGASFANGPINVNQVAVADVNGDGVPDALFAKNSAGIQVHIQSSSDALTAYLPELNLNSRSAALETGERIRDSIEALGVALGSIGAAASRIATATSNAQTAVLEFKSAASVMMDSDVAAEAAVLVRTKILQNASAAVLAQANQLPQIALSLIGSNN